MPCPMVQDKRTYPTSFRSTVLVVVLPLLSVAETTMVPDSTPSRVPSPVRVCPPQVMDCRTREAPFTAWAPVFTATWEWYFTRFPLPPVRAKVVGFTSSTVGFRVGAGFWMVRVRVR